MAAISMWRLASNIGSINGVAAIINKQLGEEIIIGGESGEWRRHQSQ
jgi:hypothetical protein